MVAVAVSVGSDDGTAVAGMAVFSAVLEATIGAVGAIVGVDLTVTTLEISIGVSPWQATNTKTRGRNKCAKILRI